MQNMGLFAMKVEELLRLYMAYAWCFAVTMFVFAATMKTRAEIRALLTLMALIPIVLTHILSTVHMVKTKGWGASPMFLVIGLLWGLKLFFLVINESLNYFLARTVLLLDWLDLVLWIVIAFIVFFSFAIKTPFFYRKATSNILAAVGFVGLALSLTAAGFIFRFAVDLYRLKFG